MIQLSNFDFLPQDTSIAGKRVLACALATLLLMGAAMPYAMSKVMSEEEKGTTFLVMPAVFQFATFVIAICIPGVYFLKNAHMRSFVWRFVKEDLVYDVVH